MRVFSKLFEVFIQKSSWLGISNKGLKIIQILPKTFEF